MDITNYWDLTAAQVMFEANDRCNQENLIEQLKNGVRAPHAPVNTLNANWAYMVMVSLAWTIKAWMALLAAGDALLAVPARGGTRHVAAHGVPHVPGCGDQRPGAGDPERTAAGRSFAGVATTVAGVLPAARRLVN
jgi:hypothetical protein